MTKPVYFIVNPITNVLGAICPSVETKSIFDALHIVALIAASVRPHFKSSTMLLISEPLTFVNGASLMSKFSIPVSLAEDPLSIIDLSGYM
jgi:hypothetical protein